MRFGEAVRRIDGYPCAHCAHGEGDWYRPPCEGCTVTTTHYTPKAAPAAPPPEILRLLVELGKAACLLRKSEDLHEAVEAVEVLIKRGG